MEPKKLSILTIQKIRKSMEFRLDEKRIKDKNFIDYMKYLMQCDGNATIQTEAAWIFTNIAAGSSDHTKLVVEAGIVPLLVKLLSSSNKEVVEQSIWGLGNITGDNTEYRNLILQHGALKPLLSFVREDMKLSFQRTIVWVFVNIVRSRESPLSVEVLRDVVPKLCLLAKQRDNSTKIDALWALTFIADCGEDYIQLIVESNIIRHVIPMLASNHQKLQITVMRLLGNIATGSDEQTQILLDDGLLNFIRFALVHHNRNLRRVSLWCLSNITIGTVRQAQAVFNSGLLPVIIDNLQHIDNTVVKEAIITVRNLISNGTIEQMLEIFDFRAINPMFNLITSNDPDVADAAHQGLSILFTKGGLLVEKYFRLYQQMMSPIDSP